MDMIWRILIILALTLELFAKPNTKLFWPMMIAADIAGFAFLIFVLINFGLLYGAISAFVLVLF